MIDVVLLGLIGLSAMLGLFRGFIGIVVGTLSWLLAVWLSFLFGGAAAQ
ncbi:CvpA family protein, partial [Bacillus sp. SIMBA_008]